MAAPQIGEETKVTLDLKTIGMIVGFVITIAGMWFGLQADIAEAKTLPEPAIDRIEYDLKDELIRQTIMDTQEDVEEIKETIEKIDERLYEIQKDIIAFLLTFNLYSQEEVPVEYWIDDNNFENKINEKEAFGSNLEQIVLVEFWAKFNEVNCFGDWDKIENAVYYRVDIAKAPQAKKKYKVRMAPTLIIFKGGVKEKVFKAGLDLVLPADLEEIQESINEINTASQF
jgi:seryl-tRNA synthetase